MIEVDTVTEFAAAEVNKNNSSELTLLGSALLEAQKVEFGLYLVITQLTAKHSCEKEKKVLSITPEAFLKGSPKKLELALSLYEQAFGDKLPMNTNEIKDFVSHRNLISTNFWRVTGADVKGGEKLANPTAYLQGFIAKCEQWIIMLNKPS